MDGEALVRDYLRRLEEAAQRAVPDQADDLVADVREHIDAALAASSGDADAVQTVLDHLGPPEALVDAAAPAGPEPTRQGEPSARPARAVVRAAPWILGGMGGVIALAAWLPTLSRTGLPPAAVLVLAPVLILAAFTLQRPGGAAFLAAAAGVAGALVIALALAVPLLCPDGEFAASCSANRIGPVLVPGLGLVVVGLLAAARAWRSA